MSDIIAAVADVIRTATPIAVLMWGVDLLVHIVFGALYSGDLLGRFR